jgi:hypothetical protein
MQNGRLPLVDTAIGEEYVMAVEEAQLQVVGGAHQ